MLVPQSELVSVVQTRFWPKELVAVENFWGINKFLFIESRYPSKIWKAQRNIPFNLHENCDEWFLLIIKRCDCFGIGSCSGFTAIIEIFVSEIWREGGDLGYLLLDSNGLGGQNYRRQSGVHDISARGRCKTRKLELTKNIERNSEYWEELRIQKENQNIFERILEVQFQKWTKQRLKHWHLPWGESGSPSLIKNHHSASPFAIWLPKRFKPQ